LPENNGTEVGGWINELQNLLAGITDLLGAWASVVHPEGVTCPYCGATFSTQEELKTHVLTVHPTAAGVGIGEWISKYWPWLAVGGTGTAIVTTLLWVKKK